MDVVIIGSGGQGRVILDILRANNIEPKGFIDDNLKLQNENINGVRIIGTTEDLFNKSICKNVIVAIGDNILRKKMYDLCVHKDLEIINAIHPKTIISPDAIIGSGVVIMAGAIINTGCKIDDNVVINTNASIDHDTHVQDHCNIHPGVTITGTVTVKKLATIGAGATIIPNMVIGSNSIVGAGAVVIKNVPDNTVVVGVPAKEIKTREEYT